MVEACGRIEGALGLPSGAMGFEIQVETPQSHRRPGWHCARGARMVHASGGRCTSLHYGTYDYSASAASLRSTSRWSIPRRTTPKQ